MLMYCTSLLLYNYTVSYVIEVHLLICGANIPSESKFVSKFTFTLLNNMFLKCVFPENDTLGLTV